MISPRCVKLLSLLHSCRGEKNPLQALLDQVPTCKSSHLRKMGATNHDLFWETGGIVNMRSFSASGLYDTEDEADLHGLAYGQRIIDGKVPGETV